MSLAIHATGIGKRYRLGSERPSGQLRDVIRRQLSAPLRAWRQRGQPARRVGPSTIWALSDVSFDIRSGEAVGIIGRNGSGKSTLLKILTRITEPTAGAADVVGRVGSLLEVGTGFHPELTGRENVYVNGAILGMRRAEIARKFDEIVAFAEVDQFIDTPVKHYSSGMQVRLAFAVAAHLEPEILLIDEVLAVGDTAFQKRCLGKMGDVTREGRTVLFVSHDLTAVQHLCQRALLLSRGKLIGDGPVAEQVRTYLRASNGGRDGLAEPVALSESLQLTRFGMAPSPIVSGQPGEFRIEVVSTVAGRIDELAAIIHDALDRRVGIIDFRRASGHYTMAAGVPFTAVARLDRVPLVEGEYRLGLSLRTGDAAHIRYDLANVDVVASGGEVVPHPVSVRGVVAFDYAVDLGA